MNKKGFTLAELLVTFVIISLISGIGVIAYKSFFDVGESNYYKSLESNILLSANDYFQDNRDMLPVADNYKEVLLSELVEKKYIEKVASSDGGECTGTVVAYRDNKKYAYEVCLVCENYQSEGKYCHSEGATPQPQRIIITARTSKGSYNPNLSYNETPYASENVTVTFNMNNIEVSKYDIINTNTREKDKCIPNNENTCEKKFNKSGTYSVTSYDKNGKVIISNQRMNIKIIEKELGFQVIGVKSKYKIENATCGSNKTVRVDFTIKKDQNKLNEEYKRIRYILKRNNEVIKEKEMSILSDTINVGIGHYELIVEITNFAGDINEMVIPFNVVYDVNLAYSDGTSGKHEVTQGYSYDYISELPKVKDAYGAKDLEIRWSKSGTRINGTSIVEDNCTHTLDGQVSIPVTPPSNFASYCVSNLIYNGSEQTLTTNAPANITFLNNVGTNAGSHTVKAHINSPIYIWSDGTFDDKTFECSIGKATPTITLSATAGTVVKGKTITFNEKASVKGKFSISSNATGKATVTQASSNEVAANTNNLVTITGVADGNATITVAFTPTDTTNYNNASNKTYTVTVTKSAAIPTNSLCVARTYTGSAQQLTSATSGTGYTLSGYSQTNAGEHTIIATLSSGYRWSDNTTGTKTFKCTLSPAKPTITCANKTYNGSNQTIATCTNGTISNATRKDAGSQNITCTGTGNYAATASRSDCKINPAQPTINCLNPKYAGGSVTVATCSNGSITSGGTATSAGTFSVSCKGTGNYAATTTKSCSVTAKTFTVRYYYPDVRGCSSSYSSTDWSNTATYGSSYSVEANWWSCPGWTFDGWTTNSGGADDGYGWTGWSGTWTFNDGSYGVSNGTLTLYPRWSAGTWHISYNYANSGQCSYSCTLYCSEKRSSSVWSCTSGSEVIPPASPYLRDGLNCWCKY